MRTMLSPEIGSRGDFARLLNTRMLVAHAVEVGSHRGAFAERLLSEWNGACLHLVDPWKVTATSKGDRESDYRWCCERIRPWCDHVIIHRMTSEEAARPSNVGGNLNFVYIDGDHSYEAVAQDIALWWPKVGVDGILAGHDYYPPECPGVVQAVREFAEDQAIPVVWLSHEYGYTSWYVYKRKETRMLKWWHSTEVTI